MNETLLNQINELFGSNKERIIEILKIIENIGIKDFKINQFGEVECVYRQNYITDQNNEVTIERKITLKIDDYGNVIWNEQDYSLSNPTYGPNYQNKSTLDTNFILRTFDKDGIEKEKRSYKDHYESGEQKLAFIAVHNPHLEINLGRPNLNNFLPNNGEYTSITRNPSKPSTATMIQEKELRMNNPNVKRETKIIDVASYRDPRIMETNKGGNIETYFEYENDELVPVNGQTKEEAFTKLEQSNNTFKSVLQEEFPNYYEILYNQETKKVSL